MRYRLQSKTLACPSLCIGYGGVGYAIRKNHVFCIDRDKNGRNWHLMCGAPPTTTPHIHATMHASTHALTHPPCRPSSQPPTHNPPNTAHGEVEGAAKFGQISKQTSQRRCQEQSMRYTLIFATFFLHAIPQCNSHLLCDRARGMEYRNL